MKKGKNIRILQKKKWEIKKGRKREDEKWEKRMKKMIIEIRKAIIEELRRKIEDWKTLKREGKRTELKDIEELKYIKRKNRGIGKKRRIKKREIRR